VSAQGATLRRRRVRAHDVDVPAAERAAELRHASSALSLLLVDAEHTHQGARGVIDEHQQGAASRALLDPRVGLCSACRFARVRGSAEGSVFWRCARAQADARFLAYPSLPVGVCSGFEERRTNET
jgi:hypothetical protein